MTRLCAVWSGTKIPAKTIVSFSVKNIQNGSGVHLFCYSKGPGFPSRGKSGHGMRLTTHAALVVSSRIHGAVPLLPIYVFMVMTGTTLPFSSLPASVLLFKTRLCVLDYGICVSPSELILLE